MSLTGPQLALQKQYESQIETYKLLQTQLQEEQKNYQLYQGKLVAIAQPRQQYESQLAENESVFKEFELLDADARVFKSSGPVLVKQDVGEAKENVKKRLDYIRSEISRLSSQYDSIEKSREGSRTKIVSLGTKVQEKESEIKVMIETAQKSNPSRQ